MEEIKYIFKVIDSHLHTGSHRCSDGWKYNFIDSTTVEGPFFSTPLNISYQDLVLLRKKAKEIIEKHSSEERDYEWAEEYTPNHSEVNEQGFGFDSYFNTTIGEKYKIHLSIGTLEDCDCPLDSDYQNGILELMDTINARVRKNIDEDLSKKRDEIGRLKKRINDIESEIKTVNSVDHFDKEIVYGIRDILEQNLQSFDINNLIYKELYPLDIAILCGNESLIETLIKHNANRYSSYYNPEISSRIGDFTHMLQILNSDKVNKSEMKLVYKQFSLISNQELAQIISDDSIEIIRDGRILLNREQHKSLVDGLTRYYEKACEWDNHGRYTSEYLLIELCKRKDYDMANRLYYWLQQISHRSIDFENMLQISFQYGNLAFIKTLSSYELITQITDRVKYSYAHKRLIFDSWGDKLALKWEYEPYIKEECIGKELCDFIHDQIDNHSSKY